jgi:hypothetical protein
MRFQATARALQERCDDSLQPWGVRAPAITAGQALDDYRRRLLILAKRQLPEEHELRAVTVRRLAADALPIFEERIYGACHAEAYRPDSVPSGGMREVIDIDKNGLKIHKFVGQRSFVHDFARPCRKAVIRNPDTHPGWFR